MKLRTLLAPVILALTLTGCGDNADYSGTYIYVDQSTHQPTKREFIKTKNNDYIIKVKLFLSKDPITLNGKIKNGVVYNESNTLMGEFKNGDYVSVNGDIYKKQTN